LVPKSKLILEGMFKNIKKSDATYNGVLSGFGTLSQIDIKGSEKFLKALKA
jgi:hypothetical protein